MNKNVYVVYAKRTAVGSFLGSLSAIAPTKMSELLIRDLVSNSGVNKDDISEVIIGQVLTSSHGQNPARQAAINSGLSDKIPAFTVSKVCGSGMKAISLGVQSIKSGDNDLVIVGGQENMSLSPHTCYLRGGVKLGDENFTDTMLKDGLVDSFYNYHMGITAENIAKRFNISREDQDRFAYESQKKASLAQKSGKFHEEILGIEIKTRSGATVFENDEFIRHEADLKKMSELRPAFDKQGTVTAANSSGINDGAAILLLASEESVKKFNLRPIARVVSYSSVGTNPEIMGSAPIEAVNLTLSKSKAKITDIDLFELNEAFASQAIHCIKSLKLDDSTVNVNGGSIAIGHPIGASGARVTVTLLHEMMKRKAKNGISSLCIGGGLGVAMHFELC